MRALRFLVLGTVAILLVAACQTSGGDAPPTTSVPPTVVPPSSTTTAPPTTTPPTTTPATTSTSVPPPTTTTVPPPQVTQLASVSASVHQVWKATAPVIVRADPGDHNRELDRLAVGAHDVDSTGRRAEVDGRIWMQVELTGSRTGWVPAAALVHQITDLVSERPARYVVTGLTGTDALNVRVDPGVDHAALTTVKGGTLLETTGLRAEVQGVVWRQVEYQTGRTGWVNGRYLTPEVVELSDDDPALFMVVGLPGGERLNVRTGPGVTNDVITTLASDATDVQTTGERAEVLGSVWRQIELAGGRLGWVNGTYLALQPPPAPTPCRPGDGDFCPYLDSTRATAAAFLSRALGLRGDGGKDWFTDDNGSLFEVEINRLAEAGVLRGCNPPDNTRICPNDPATRAQVAAWFSRALALSDDGGKDWFVDDGGHRFEVEINQLAATGIARACNPPDNDRFCPDKPIVRGQVAAWIVRAFRLPATGTDFFADDDGTIFEDDINRIAAAGIAAR